MKEEIQLDNLCPTTAAEIVENLSEDNEKGADFKSTGRTELIILYCALLFP